MSFVAAPPANPPAAIPDAIAGDGWWPDLSIAKFRDTMRIPTEVTDGRCRAALIGGFVSADVELAAWRAAREAEGAASLEAIDGPSIGDEKRAVILWRRAVHATAAAELAETHNDISATNDTNARDQNERRAAWAADHRRNATVAVRDLLGRTRSRAALL